MSKLLDQQSSPVTVNALDLFTVPPTQVAMKRSFWSENHLQNPCTNYGPWNFIIPPDMYMLQLSKNYIYVRLRIVRPDGTALQHLDNDGAATDVVGAINLLGKTFFRQIKLYLNNKLVSDSGELYAYRSFIETELNCDQGVKQYKLEAALYKPNQPNRIDNAQNEGFQARCQPFRYSQWVELMAPIHIDLFMQNRCLLSQCELRLELYRNTDPFCLLS